MMPKKDGTLTPTELRWLGSLRAVLRKVPPGLEVIIPRDGFVEVWPRGSLRAHLDDNYASNFGMNTGGDLASFSAPRVHPYSEGQ